jgi:F-type H+-transporting ATPase subunit a
MHHEHSVFFRLFNELLTRLLGPVENVRSWWTDGITIGRFHMDGVAARGEHGELIGWIPDHVAMALVVFLFCAIFFPLVKAGYRRDVPGKIQNVVELFVDFLRGLIKENIPEPHHDDHGHGHAAPHRSATDKYLPIVGAFFFFIFLANFCGLFFFLQPPTANLNTTFALSITCFLFFNAAGIRAHGFLGYLKHFLGPVLALAPLMFTIEMIGNFARALSLSMRLYGNIFGEHTATGIFTSLVPIVVPWPMLALGIFGALLQAYVFTLLTTVYLGGATAHEH